MSEKTFLVTMYSSCPCCEKLTNSCKADYKYLHEVCAGRLNNRPEWCPIVEVQHSDQVPTSTLCKNVWLEI